MDAALREKLHYVKVSDPSVSLACFPDFLIVGPQRTGTTWLHANLREHPQIYMAEPKELFFFSHLKIPEDPKFRSAELAWYLSCFRDPPSRWLIKQALCLRMYGRPYRPRVRGEATASYATIDPDVIDDVVALNPAVKVILMVRNPIERAWSHANKDLVRNPGRRIEEVSDEEFESFFEDPYQRSCARYGRCIDNWAERLRRGHLYVGAFDEISRRPTEFMLDVLGFLGVAAKRRYVGSSVDRPVNPAGAAAIPEDHRNFLVRLFASELDELRERFGLSWSSDGKPDGEAGATPNGFNLANR